VSRPLIKDLIVKYVYKSSRAFYFHAHGSIFCFDNDYIHNNLLIPRKKGERYLYTEKLTPIGEISKTLERLP